MNFCIVCRQKGSDVTKVGVKGLQSLIKASHKKGDGLEEEMKGDCFLHESCRKKYLYVNKRDAECIYKAPIATCSRRSSTELFNFQTHCLICGMEIDYEEIKRHPDRVSAVSKVELVNKGKSVLQESLMKACSLRADDLAVDVKRRIMMAQDLPAVEATYHHKCLKLFTNKLNINSSGSSVNYRNFNFDNETAFERLCSWLQKDCNIKKQYTFAELTKHMATYLPEGMEPYSVKHLKNRLKERFGEQFICSELDGKNNVITFKAKATTILHDVYATKREDEFAEIFRNIQDVGSNISKILQNGDFKDDFYPSSNETNLDALESQIPIHLFNLIKEIVCGQKKENNQSKQLVITSICHAIMQAARPRAYISPLQLTVGLFVHQTTRSKVLIDALSALGVCCSYNHVLNFQKCATEKATYEGVPGGLTKIASGGGFCQWVADNFDWNEDTISGHDTTHVMGIIACQAGNSRTAASNEFLVKRKTATASEIIKSGSFCNLILPFKQSLKSKMADVIVQPLRPIRICTLGFQLVDNLWLISSRLLNVHVQAPNWQGFMAKASNGSYLCSTVVYNPMIPLNPQTCESVYSTMVFVQNQSKELGQHCTVITFDQPLYLKAYTIKKDRNYQFKNMFVRLGGFHLLMSFLGSGCKVMEDSGIEDLWCEVYAKNSLNKIMEGKSYTKTLRSCLLTDAALHMLLLAKDDKSSLAVNKDDMFGDDFNESMIQITELNEDINMLDPFHMYHEDQLPMILAEEVVDCGSVQQSDDTQQFILDEEMPYMSTEEIVTTSESPMTTANDLETEEKMFSNLKILYQDIIDGKVDLEKVVENRSLHHLNKHLERLKKEASISRTAKLWLLFMDFVNIIRMFIRAERSGFWELHLHATQLMLPFLAAAGHNNYTKCCRLYLEDAQNLCSCMVEDFKHGLFTIRRNKKQFWSGTWSDMVIEQSLMRSGKASGGLINITHREASKMVWLLSAHILAQYSEGMRNLTSTYSGTWSEQHRETGIARIKRDCQDMNKFLQFLRNHNPFEAHHDCTALVNIATGVVADDRVNVDNSLEIGRKINESITGKSFSEIKMKKSQQAVTFSVMRKPVNLNVNERIYSSSAELSQRLIAIASCSEEVDPAMYSFELSSVAPSLFSDDGLMRKSSKSQLAKHIKDLSTDICSRNEITAKITVIDGCALLQQMPWPKVGTVKDSCLHYIEHVTSHYQKFPDQQPFIIFDSYEKSTTKDMEQKRRRLHNTAAPEIIVQKDNPIPNNKSCFLTNKKNKQSYINLLSSLLVDSDIKVIHAGDEGDADVVIVRTVLQLSESGEAVVVISEDTDIFVLLLHHVKPNQFVFMQTKTHSIDISKAQQYLGTSMCRSLPFLHAMSGCDTTSAFFGMGKVKVMKIYEKSINLQEQVVHFGNFQASKEELGKIGESFILALYGAHSSVKSLDELRFLNMLSTKYVPLEKLPPTSRSAYFHSLRVHHQTSTWLHLSTVLPKEDYGFCLSGDEWHPVITDKPAAPDYLLREIRCSCCRSENRCATCNCAKKRLPCSIHCKCAGQCENSLKLSFYLDDTD